MKIMERCPLKFSLIQRISCLVPQRIVDSPALAESRFRNCVQYLVSANRITTTWADDAIEEFSMLKDDASKAGHLSRFNREDDRLDLFYYDLIGNSGTYSNLWSICQVLFVTC